MGKLRPSAYELPSGHEGLELHGAPLSPALRNPGWQVVTGTKETLVAEACNRPNCLVLPFSFELIRPAA
jgi:hypothetical protein